MKSGGICNLVHCKNLSSIKSKENKFTKRLFESTKVSTFVNIGATGFIYEEVAKELAIH